MDSLGVSVRQSSIAFSQSPSRTPSAALEGWDYPNFYDESLDGLKLQKSLEQEKDWAGLKELSLVGVKGIMIAPVPDPIHSGTSLPFTLLLTR
jgi:hypothetical protein